MSIIYINKARELADAIGELKQIHELCLDLEFDKNRYRYGFNLCLMQLYTGSDCYLIDPLAGLDISPVFPILEDPQIQKVVFAFGEDLRLLHSLGCFPRKIYDINIATSLLNYPSASLTNYLKQILGLKMGESSQQSNWYKRPLTDQQMSYAARDVRYLIDLKEVLQQEATDKKIDHWIEEENREYDHLNYSDLDDKSYIREEDKNGFTEFEWYLYCQMLELRESYAKKHNRPSYQIIDKQVLSVIARNGQSLTAQYNSASLYSGIDPKQFREQVQKKLKLAQREANRMNLSKIKPALETPSEKELEKIKRRKYQINLQKNKYLKPIKEKLTNEYGKQTASYLLSNRIMSELMEGNRSVTKKYKEDLFLEIAKELNLDQEVLRKIIS